MRAAMENFASELEPVESDKPPPKASPAWDSDAAPQNYFSKSYDTGNENSNTSIGRLKTRYTTLVRTWSSRPTSFNIHPEDRDNQRSQEITPWSVRLRYQIFPGFMLCADVLQFTFLPWNFSIAEFPRDVEDIFQPIVEFPLFTWVKFGWAPSFGYPEAMYFLALSSILSLIYLAFPRQKLVASCGQKAAVLIGVIVRLMQTVLCLPFFRLGCTAFVCDFDTQRLQHDSSIRCWDKTHVPLILAGISIIACVGFGGHLYVLDSFSSLEKTKRMFTKVMFTQSSARIAHGFLVAKLGLACFGTVFRQFLSDSVISLTNLLFVGGLFFLLIWDSPFTSQRVGMTVSALLSVCTFSNAVAVVNSVLSETDEYNDGKADDNNNGNEDLVVNVFIVWLVGLPSAYVAGAYLYQRVCRYKISKIVEDSATSKTLSLSGVLQDPLQAVWQTLQARICDAGVATILKELNLAGCWLNSQELQQVLFAVGAHPDNMLESLDCSRQKLKGTVGHGVDVSLQYLPRLKTLVLNNNSLPPGIPMIARSLASHKHITKISMANCGLTELAGESLGAMLKENKSLTELNIAKNFLGKAGAKGLAEGLTMNSTLKTLDICWNSIGAEGVGYLVNSSLGNRKLKMRVIGNNVEKVTLQAYYDQLKANALSDDGDSEARGPTLEELLAQTECDSVYDLIGKVTNLEPAVAVEAVCERFYFNLISDEICLPFFSCVAMGRMRNLQKDCLIELLGGPKIYKGLDLKTGHAHLKITDEHYDSVIDHLFAAILHFIPDLPSCVATALTDITEAARLLVVNTQLDEPHLRLLSACDVEDQYMEALNHDKAEAFFTNSLWRTGNFKKRGAGHPALEVSD